MSEQLADNIEIIILAHPRKPCLTAETLGSLGIPYWIFDNSDWDWPEDHPELEEDREERPIMRGYALRQYRAFRGHQTLLSMADPEMPYTMVFEDDMSLVPGVTRDEVIAHINGGIHFIERMGYDAVSYHARKQTPPKDSFAYLGREYVELSGAALEGDKNWGHRYFLRPVARGYNGKYEDYVFKWHEGCLAYMVGPHGRAKWARAGHGHGMPCDLFLANELRTIVMKTSIFHHDLRYGSLIANTGKVQNDLHPNGAEKIA